MQVVLWITVAAWGLGEIGLQLRQRLRSDRTVTSEWGSYLALGAGAAVGFFLAAQIRRLVPGVDFPARSTGWLVVIVVLIVLGAGFRLWAIVTLGQYFRAVVHLQEGHQVVRSGPYRVLRHPSYTGLLVAVLGVSLLFGNLLSALVLWLFVIAAVLYRIRVEERVLLTGLGDAYADYMRETNRLIPGVW